MSEVRTFFRHCPECGRRFEIRIVRKEPEKVDSYESEAPPSDVATTRGRALVPLVLNPEANEPAIAVEREFDYTYLCKHCGHRWTEVHEEADVEAPPEGYGGD